MTKYILTIKNTLLSLSIAFLLQACGGSNNKKTYEITTNESALYFTIQQNEIPSSSAKIEVKFTGEGLLLGFSPDSQPQPWLKYRTENVTQNSATIYVDVVNTEFFDSKLYKTKLRLSTGKIDAASNSIESAVDLIHQDIDISLLISKLISFKAVPSQSTVSSQNNLLFTSEDRSWAISKSEEWLNAELIHDETTNSLFINTSVNMGEGLESGLYQTKISLMNTNTNEEFSLPLELGVDEIYLYSDKPQVAFVSTPNSVFTESILTVANNTEKKIDWQVTTEADWLTLVPLSNGTQFKIIADPTKVTENETAFASITISALNNINVHNDIVGVNLFHSTSITAKKVLDLDGMMPNLNAIALAPNRPYAYIGIKNEIQIFDTSTGLLIDSILVSPENTLVEQLVIHPNGSMLLAQAIETRIENGESPPITHRYKVNLKDKVSTELVDSSIKQNPLQIIRLSGRYFVITEALDYADLNLNVLYPNGEKSYGPSKIAVAAQTGAIFATYNNSEDGISTIKRVEVEVNDYTAEPIEPKLTHSYHPSTLADDKSINDLAVTSDEKDLYIVSETSEWISFDGISFIDHGLLDKETIIVNYDGITESAIVDEIATTDITTHSVYLNSLDEPYYINTIKLPNRSVNIFETFINTYNVDNTLTSSTLASINAQSFSTSPILIALPLSTQQIVIHDKTDNQVSVNLAPFNSDTYEVTFDLPFSKSTDSEQIIKLSNIDSEHWIPSTNLNWISFKQNIENLNELIIELVNYESIEVGVHHGVVTVYDITNQAYTTIDITLNKA